MVFSRNPLLITTLGLALLGAACGRSEDKAAALPPASGAGAAPRPELPTIAIGDSTAATERVATTQEATTGTTYAHAEAQLAPKLSGTIADIMVEEGDRVKKGQLLFRLETGDIALRVKQAEAGLKSAQVQLKAASVDWERVQRLFEKSAIDRAQYDRAQAAFEGAQAAVDATKVGVSVARQALADASVRSPIAGVVTAKLKNKGEVAAMMPPTIVLVIQDDLLLELRFRLPERALAKVKVGDQIRAQFNAVGVTRTATIRRINPSVDARTRTVEMVAEIDNKDGALKPGMLAEIESAALAAEGQGDANAAGSTTGGEAQPAEAQPAKDAPAKAPPAEGAQPAEAKSAKAAKVGVNQ